MIPIPTALELYPKKPTRASKNRPERKYDSSVPDPIELTDPMTLITGPMSKELEAEIEAQIVKIELHQEQRIVINPLPVVENEYGFEPVVRAYHTWQLGETNRQRIGKACPGLVHVWGDMENPYLPNTPHVEFFVSEACADSASVTLVKTLPKCLNGDRFSFTATYGSFAQGASNRGPHLLGSGSPAPFVLLRCQVHNRTWLTTNILRDRIVDLFVLTYDKIYYYPASIPNLESP